MTTSTPFGKLGQQRAVAHVAHDELHLIAVEQRPEALRTAAAEVVEDRHVAGTGAGEQLGDVRPDEARRRR